MTTFDVGDRVKALGNFTDADGVLVDPTDVNVKYKDPSQVITPETYNGGAGNVVKEAVGIYSLEFSLDAPGWWWVRFEGTGVREGAEEMKFWVVISEF